MRKPERNQDRFAIGIAVGTGVGCVLSALADNPALIGVGVALGTTWGVLGSGTRAPSGSGERTTGR